jgi:hypothetical protein
MMIERARVAYAQARHRRTQLVGVERFGSGAGAAHPGLDSQAILNDGEAMTAGIGIARRPHNIRGLTWHLDPHPHT